MRIKPLLNKWQTGFQVGLCPPWRIGFYPYLTVWYLKINSLPGEGEMLSPQHYRGVLWAWQFIRNLVVEERSFIVPDWLRRLFPRLHKVYVVPVRFWFNGMVR